uniref:[Hydroxymethylglutaryl-CoA reductase (NADPH)] kinase n=3 Tax=Opuntia streptacantha TaxID=393608 RepID=A0A7C8ZVM6_OPUST
MAMSMGCHTIGLERYCPGERVLCLSWGSLRSNLNRICRVCYTVAPLTQGAGSNKFVRLHQTLSEKIPPCHSLWRTNSVPVDLEEQSLSGAPDIGDDGTDSDDQLARPLSSEELKAMLADSERAKLLTKLSEANQQNRFLKRQLQGKEDALIHFKTELAVVEQEMKVLVALADEIAKAGIPEGSRKINGKFIQSHLLSRLEVVQKKLQGQIKDVDAAQSKEVPVVWIGMAESVQVMGSFDGWSQGEHLSPEYTGSYTKFSTTLLLRPGRYEIKFLVDGEWQISPEFPTVGEGVMKNNLLVVE